MKFIKTDTVATNESTDELDDWENLYSEDIFDIELKDGYRKLNIDYRSIKYVIEERGHRYVEKKIVPELPPEVINLLLI